MSYRQKNITFLPRNPALVGPSLPNPQGYFALHRKPEPQDCISYGPNSHFIHAAVPLGLAFRPVIVKENLCGHWSAALLHTPFV